MHPQSQFSGYTLQWQDEFNGESLDSKKWQYDTDSAGNTQGWGNGEEQYYTDSTSNAYVKDDALVIEARAESRGGKQYTSARIHTHGLYSVTYGLIEARIRLPSGVSGNTDAGTWPAFWLLGDNFSGWGHTRYGGTVAWPWSGEIDVMESNHHTSGYRSVGAAIHYDLGSSVGTANPRHEYLHDSASIEAASQYHIYSMEWTENSIVVFLDYKKYFEVSLSDKHDEFKKPFFLLLNLAVGGQYPGTPDPSNYPQGMHVDWVRVYQK